MLNSPQAHLWMKWLGQKILQIHQEQSRDCHQRLLCPFWRAQPISFYRVRRRQKWTCWMLPESPKQWICGHSWADSRNFLSQIRSQPKPLMTSERALRQVTSGMGQNRIKSTWLWLSADNSASISKTCSFPSCKPLLSSSFLAGPQLE